MPLRNDGIICRECGGAGCQSCGDTGYSYMRRQEAPQFPDMSLVPMPYGKLLPDIAECHYANDEDTPDWLIIYCPNCGSENVVGLPDYYDADWFCISCQDSWCYEREH